jgi:hypothetical protein
MFRKISFLVTLGSILLASAVGCSSESKPDTQSSTAGTSPGAKTCADVAKCCDKQSEPQKSACTALANGKVENACAAGYDAACGGTPDSGVAVCKDEGEPCTDSSQCCRWACSSTDGTTFTCGGA